MYTQIEIKTREILKMSNLRGGEKDADGVKRYVCMYVCVCMFIHTFILLNRYLCKYVCVCIYI
jgi:hypothetical protein